MKIEELETAIKEAYKRIENLKGWIKREREFIKIAENQIKNLKGGK